MRLSPREWFPPSGRPPWWQTAHHGIVRIHGRNPPRWIRRAWPGFIAGPRSRTSSTWSSRPGITPSPLIGPPSLRGGRQSRSPKRATDRPRAGSPSLGGDQQPKLPREGVAGGSIRSLPRALLRITTTTKPPGIPSRVRPTRVGPRGACSPISITHSATRQSDSH